MKYEHRLALQCLAWSISTISYAEKTWSQPNNKLRNGLAASGSFLFFLISFINLRVAQRNKVLIRQARRTLLQTLAEKEILPCPETTRRYNLLCRFIRMTQEYLQGSPNNISEETLRQTITQSFHAIQIALQQKCSISGKVFDLDNSENNLFVLIQSKSVRNPQKKPSLFFPHIHTNEKLSYRLYDLQSLHRELKSKVDALIPYLEHHPTLRDKMNLLPWPDQSPITGEEQLFLIDETFKKIYNKPSAVEYK